MSEREAQRLAERIGGDTGAVAVRREGRWFVVVLDDPSGTHTLRDEADWDWLRRQAPPPP